MEQFALDHADKLQVVGVGSQDDFGQAQDFLSDTGVSEIAMLWEGSGNIWNLQQVRANSAIQLYSHDLEHQSGLFWFNDDGRSVALDASGQSPWAPADSSDVSQ